MLRHFRFLQRSPDTSGAIANLHPAAGEQALYSVSTAYPEIHRKQSFTDYAIVALRPGLSGHHSILILAGITEFGTQGAAEFVKGGMLMNLSRAANARKFSTTHGNTQGLRMADDRFTSNADPLMYTYQNLPKGPARTEFIQRHFKSADDKNDFIRRKNVVEHYGGFEQ